MCIAICGYINTWYMWVYVATCGYMSLYFSIKNNNAMEWMGMSSVVSSISNVYSPWLNKEDKCVFLIDK